MSDQPAGHRDVLCADDWFKCQCSEITGKPACGKSIDRALLVEWKSDDPALQRLSLSTFRVWIDSAHWTDVSLIRTPNGDGTTRVTRDKRVRIVR